MSKSLNNAIGVHEPAGEMYGKLMSISDELMWRYWTLLTDLRASEIEAMQEQVRGGSLHPMQAKKNLAWTITKGFHSAAEADAAAESWAKMFQQRGVSEDVPVVKIDLRDEGLLAMKSADGGMLIATSDPELGTEIRLAKLLTQAGLASSAGEATRKLAENAVSVNGEKLQAGKIVKTVSKEFLGDAPVLRLGKKSVRVEWVK
jgi:tyrosyl-tRNA synthetase